MRPGRVGPRALLIETDGPGRARALWRELRAADLPGVEEIVAGARTVLVVAGPDGDLDALEAEVPRYGAAAPEVAAGRELVIPVVYAGPDLAAVADLAGMSEEEVVRRHTSCGYTVNFVGFSPGFAYLSGGDPALQVPRLDTPRTSVPAGSVAIAGDMTAVYPQATPGGWRLIGWTSETMFDPTRSSPALLDPGDRVRFESVRSLAEAAVPATPVDAAPTAGSSYIEMLDPGPLTTVQDLGRRGWAHAGVPRAGAADRLSATLANRLVGNPDGAALLESTLSGPRLRIGTQSLVAVCGARADVTVDGFPARQDAALALPAGSELAVGRYRRGARLYVAFSGGGIGTPEVLGSRSADTLSGLGPAPLRPGERIPLLVATGLSPSGPPPAPRTWPQASQPVVVKVRRGPRSDWITTAGLRALGSAEFAVRDSSDRTAARLVGPPIGLAHGRQLPSEGIVAGAVQIPPDGQPIVMLRNHPTTGGYPVAAVVDDAGVDLLGQARPGDLVRFDLY